MDSDKRTNAEQSANDDVGKGALSVKAIEKLSAALRLRKTIDNVNMLSMIEARLEPGTNVASSDFLRNYTLVLEAMEGKHGIGENTNAY